MKTLKSWWKHRKFLAKEGIKFIVPFTFKVAWALLIVKLLGGL